MLRVVPFDTDSALVVPLNCLSHNRAALNGDVMRGSLNKKWGAKDFTVGG